MTITDDISNAVQTLADSFGDHGEAPEQTSAGWVYGPPETTARESNFISDENLLVWLAQKEEGLYGELREHMDTSRARSKLVEDLSHLKEHVDANADPGEVARELDALLEAYAGTPFSADLEELLAPMRASFDVNLTAAAADPAGFLPSYDELSAAIQSKIDALGRDDQLELIQIQSLTADIREAAQLASNLLANANQTANTIVGNIAR